MTFLGVEPDMSGVRPQESRNIGRARQQIEAAFLDRLQMRNCECVMLFRHRSG